MSYQPTPDDVRCAACGEWFHKALKACPMCDVPYAPPVMPASPAYPRKAAPGTPPPIRQQRSEVPMPVKAAGWSAPPLIFFFCWWAFPTPTPPAQITREEYNRIEVGMTYKETVAVIGEEGKIDWENESEYTGHLAQVQWSAGGGSFAICHFTRGRVSDKSWYAP